KRRPGLAGFVLRFGISRLLRGLRALEQLDPFARGELDHGLLPGPGAADAEAAALRLRAHLGGAHLRHLDPEDLVHRLRDLGLVGAVVDPEGVLALGDQRVALLRDHRADEDRAGVHQAAASSVLLLAPRRSSSVFSAVSEMTIAAAPITSATPVA